MQDEEGQILEAHSISAGLDYPGAGPEHAYLRDTGRARYVAVTDDAGARRVPRASRGSRASSRRSRPRTRSHWVLAARPRASSTSSACRGAATRTSPRCSRGRDSASCPTVAAGDFRRSARDEHVPAANAGVERIAAAFAGSGKRAALMPYLMGGFPDLDDVAARSARPTPTAAPTSSSSASRSPTRSPTAR